MSSRWALRCPVGHASLRRTPDGQSDYTCKACEEYEAWGTDGHYDAAEIEEVAG